MPESSPPSSAAWVKLPLPEVVYFMLAYDVSVLPMVEMPMASPLSHVVPDARVCTPPIPAVTCAATGPLFRFSSSLLQAARVSAAAANNRYFFFIVVFI